nr:MAG TPA: hypothetical protein [Caudoviricetes sp.]
MKKHKKDKNKIEKFRLSLFKGLWGQGATPIVWTKST